MKAGFAETSQYQYFKQRLRSKQSPPIRGRGLKPSICFAINTGSMSPPIRGRGLKRARNAIVETALVAPHTGAWIETLFIIPLKPLSMSPPIRGRGLKLDKQEKDEYWRWVAPHTGAWIETLYE